MAGTGDEEPLVDVRTVVAGRAGDAKLARRATEDLGAVEQHVAIGDQRQVGLIYALLFETQYKQGQRILIEDVRARRQRCGKRHRTAAEGNGFRHGGEGCARRKIGDAVVGGEIVGNNHPRRRHGFVVGFGRANTQNPGRAGGAGQLQPGPSERAGLFGVSGGEMILDRAIKLAGRAYRLLCCGGALGRQRRVKLFVDAGGDKTRRGLENRFPIFARDGGRQRLGRQGALAREPIERTLRVFRPAIGLFPGALHLVPGNWREIAEKQGQPVSGSLGQPGGLSGRGRHRRPGDEANSQRETASESGNPDVHTCLRQF